jgi:hypothetical protein
MACGPIEVMDMPSHSRMLFRLLGAACIIALAGVLLIAARPFVLAWFGITVSGYVYRFAAAPLFLLAAFLAAKPTIALLKADAASRQGRSRAAQFSHEGVARSVFTFPVHTRLLGFCFVALLVGLPYLSAPPGAPIAPATYFVCFGAAALSIVGMIYLLRYKVTIRADGFVIRTFGTREISFDQIATFSVITPASVPPADRRAVVLLMDGEEITFYRALAGYDDLVRTLASRAPKLNP